MTTDAIDKLLQKVEQIRYVLDCTELREIQTLGKSVKIELIESSRECEMLEKMAMRYEKLRKLNVSQFQELYLENLKGTASFDSLVDCLL